MHIFNWVDRFNIDLTLFQGFTALNAAGNMTVEMVDYSVLD